MKKTCVVAVALAAVGAVVACSSDPGFVAENQPPSTAATNDAGPNDDLTLPYEPKFEPDYNRLVANPAANLVTQAQQDKVTVTPTTLELASGDAEDAREWQPGKIVVGAPGAGMNPLGFARRVVSVKEENGKVVVVTESLGLEDLVSGDFQVRFDPKLAKEVDVSKLDPKWAYKNLYYSGRPQGLGDQSLTTNYPFVRPAAGVPGQPGFFDDVARGVKSVPDIVSYVGSRSADGYANLASDLADKANEAYGNVFPPTFDGSIGLGDTFSGSGRQPLFKQGGWEYVKDLNINKVPMRFKLSGDGYIDASLSFRPGFQIGASIPNPLSTHPGPLGVWVNVDSHAEAKLRLDATVAAALESADGVTQEELKKKLDDPSTAERILAAQREAIFGSPELRSGAVFYKSLYQSKPSTQVFTVGPIPVVITTTVQVDLECTFAAQASIHTDIELDVATNFTFQAKYSSDGSSRLGDPLFNSKYAKNIQITGSGTVATSCGLVPRINVFLYDAVGINVGVRTKLLGNASYASTCSATTTKPSGRVDIGVAAGLDVLVGGRLQVPGSSSAGNKGSSLGFDIGPSVVYAYEKPLGGWSFPAPGFGYCTPLCSDGKLSGAETDVDCGGGACPACLDEKKCRLNTDCANPGFCNIDDRCKVNTCFDRVKDADESDIDCGGKKCSSRCTAGRWCAATTDCDTGLFCSKATKTCVTSSCDDGVRNGDDFGIDCGGATCDRCADGVGCGVASACASGISDGTFCRANKCGNRTKDADESGVDCGGTSSCGKCGQGLACAANADCLDGYRSIFCSPTTRTCAVNPDANCFDGTKNNLEGDVDCGGPCAKKCDDNQTCINGSSCASGICQSGRCLVPTCTDGVKNGGEGDVDCGGPCAKCALGRTCNAKADCTTGNCPAATKVCAPTATCFDGIKNGDEADSDCGAVCPLKCDKGKSCGGTSDCFSDNCVANVCGDPLPRGLVFVTTSTYPANFGGLAGADAACQAAATSVSFGGTWKAYLSDATTSAVSRMTVRGNGYQLPDGTLVANTGAEFFSFAHTAPLDVTEAGVRLTQPALVWTGTSPNAATGDWCNGWTKQFGTLPPIGSTDATNSSWSSSSTVSYCDASYRLYCVLQ